MKILRNEWINFRRDVIPAKASIIQVEEMQKAFYAGANSLFVAMVKNLTEGEEAEDMDVQLLSNISQELIEFFNDLKRAPG